MKILRYTFCCLILLYTTLISWAKNDKSENGQPAQVLIIGLHDNVKSNYYAKSMIAEETGIQQDSIDHQYNYIIAQNIATTVPNSSCKFISGNNPDLSPIIGKIEVKGEGENCISDLSKISTDELQTMLNQAQANYLLVLNQHYLKWQGQPMHTVFHMISYTLYDKNKNEVLSGNQYFTSMNLEAPEKIKQISKKSSSKIASSVIKSLNL